LRLRIVWRGRGSAVTSRRAQIALLLAQGMDPAGIARVAFTSEDRALMPSSHVTRRRCRGSMPSSSELPGTVKVTKQAAFARHTS
jgi:hypothetical protein